MLQERADQLAVSLGKTATFSGGGAAFWFGLTANELAAIGGVVIAAVGICIQWYFGRRRDRREAEFHTARLKRLWTGEDEDS